MSSRVNSQNNSDDDSFDSENKISSSGEEYKGEQKHKKSNLIQKERKKKIKKDKSTKDKKNKKKKDKKNKKKKRKNKQPKWGKYGIISTGDMFMKREEFMMWLSEVKRLNIESIAQQEERKYFDEYVESYNTATLPSKKYYNFKIWFTNEQIKGYPPKSDAEGPAVDYELEKRFSLIIQKSFRREKQQQKAILINQKIKNEYQNLCEFEDMAYDMQKQKQLQELMRHQYLMGNHEAALKIQKQLAPQKNSNYMMMTGGSQQNDDDQF